MQLKTLGSLELISSEFRRPKPLLLLTYLSLEGSKSRSDLAELFYLGVSDPMNSLRVALRHIRSGTEGSLRTEGDRVEAVTSSDATELLRAAEQQDHEAVIALYTGSFLDGFNLKDWPVELEDWVYETREYLAGIARRSFVSQALLEARSSVKHASDLASKAFRLAGAAEPEPDLLVTLYALLKLNQHPDSKHIKTIADDYSVDLTDALSTLDLPENSKTTNTKQSLNISHNIQARATRFVGRKKELELIKLYLGSEEARLLSLQGPGGIGKTRLVTQVALELLRSSTSAFKDGIFITYLDVLSHEDQMPRAIADTLGLGLSQGNHLEQVKAFIGSQSMLLILDNFEHLINAASLCTDLLNHCENLRLIVTSRERLNIAHEKPLEILCLNVPDTSLALAEVAKSHSVTLFEDRIRRIQPSFKLNEDNLKDVISIIQIVDGLPLGIELAAASTRLIPLNEIVNEIQKDLDNLYSPDRDISSRHQSLRATFEYGWKLLTSKEQSILKNLSVCQAGFTRQAASQIAGATIPILRSLVDKALLKVDNRGRYSRHSLIYQFANEKFLEDPKHAQTQEKHAAYYTQAAQNAEPHLISKRQLEYLNTLELEHDNHRAALSWSLLHKPDLAVTHATALRRFWEAKSYEAEGRKWLMNAVEKARVKTTPAYLACLYATSAFLRAQHDLAAAATYLEECKQLAELLNERAILADTLNQLAGIAWTKGKSEEAKEILERSIELKRELGDKRGTAISLGNLGLLAQGQENYSFAQTLYEESLQIHTDLGDDVERARSLRKLGRLFYQQSDFRNAEVYLEQSLAIFKRSNTKKNMGFILNDLGCIACHFKNYDAALSYMNASYEIAKDLNLVRDKANVLQGYGLIAYAQNDFAKAQTYYKDALDLIYRSQDLASIINIIDCLANTYMQYQDFEFAAQLWGFAKHKLPNRISDLEKVLNENYQMDIKNCVAALGSSRFKKLQEDAKHLSLEDIVHSVRKPLEQESISLT